VDFVDREYATPSLPIERWPKLDVEYAEAHIMADKPESYLSMIKDKGICRAIIQVEAVKALDELVREARRLDVLLGFAINLDIDLSNLRPYWEASSYFQVMGVPPGRGGQRLDSSAILAVNYLRKTFPHSLTITFDGGINVDNIAALKRAGVDYFLCGSSIFSGRDWSNNYQALLEAIENA